MCEESSKAVAKPDNGHYISIVLGFCVVLFLETILTYYFHEVTPASVAVFMLPFAIYASIKWRSVISAILITIAMVHAQFMYAPIGDRAISSRWGFSPQEVYCGLLFAIVGFPAIVFSLKYLKSWWALVAVSLAYGFGYYCVKIPRALYMYETLLQPYDFQAFNANYLVVYAFMFATPFVALFLHKSKLEPRKKWLIAVGAYLFVLFLPAIFPVVW